MLKNSYKAKFLEQLNSCKVQLAERLDMAFGAVISQNVPLPNKGQIIFDWLATCLHENPSNATEILKMIKKTLACDQFAAFSDPIDPSKLIEAFSQLEDEQIRKCNQLLINCLVLLLQNPGFQRFCRFDIQPMCEATVLACRLMSKTSLIEDTGSSDDPTSDSADNFVKISLENLIESVHNIYTVTQQRSELKLQFVKLFLPVLLHFKCYLEDFTIFHNLFEEMVISEDLTLVCEAFKCESQRKIHPHLRALVNLMINSDLDLDSDVVFLNSLLFDSYVQSCQKIAKFEPNHMAMFYTLTSVAGVPLQLPYKTSINTNLLAPQKLSVLNGLVGVLQKHNIPVSSESEEGILSTHLVSIEKQLLSDDCCMSVELLRTIQNIFNVYPESVKLVFSEFAQYVMFVEKQDSKIMKCYNNLLVVVMKTFSDLNQLDKFFALFFHKSGLAAKESRLDNLTMDMILSEGFFTVLSDKLPSLTGNQLKTIIGRMEKTLSKYLDDSGDFIDSLYPEIIVRILHHLLENAFIVMPTRWTILSEDMRALALTVQRFGDVAVEDCEEELMLGFLRLVKVLVDIELALNHYTISLATEQFIPRGESDAQSSEVHDLSQSHGFLPASKWQYVSEFVAGSVYTWTAHCWNDLLMQKHVRLNDSSVVTHLTLSAEGDWLWGALPRLVGSIALKHLDPVTDRLLDPYYLDTGIFADKLTALKSIDVFTNRPFRAAMNLQMLVHLSRGVPDKKSVSRKMVKLIDISATLKHESDVSQSKGPEELNSITKALCEVMNKCSWDSAPVTLTQRDKEHFERLVQSVTILSPHCLKTETKRIICLTLMGLSFDFRCEDSLVQSFLEIFTGCLDDGSSVIPDMLDRGALVRWLATVVPEGFVLRHDLTRLALSKVVYSFDKCVDGIAQVIQGDCGLLCAMLEALIKVHGNKSLKNKEEFQKNLKLLIYMTSSYFESGKETFLNLYTVALKAELIFFKDKKPSLLPNLSCYLDILFKRLAKNSVVEPSTMELIDLTLNLKPYLEAEQIEKVNSSVTKELCKIDLCPMLCYPNTVRVFFESQSSEHFEQTINEIFKHQQEAMVSSLSNVCELWTILVSSHLDRGKVMVRQKLLTSTLGRCHSVLEQEPSRVHPAVVNLLHTISVSKSVVLTEKLLDFILVILEEVPTDVEAHLLPECFSVLDSLINVRSEHIFDRIPAFLQRVRKFIKSLVIVASAETSETLTFNSISTTSVNHLTRIVKRMTDQHGKHFTRISPYLIADMLNFLVSYPIESSIKIEMQNSVCILLAICDHRGTQLLQTLLPLPAMELFKVLSTTFNKSYKYTGKV